MIAAKMAAKIITARRTTLMIICNNGDISDIEWRKKPVHDGANIDQEFPCPSIKLTAQN